MNVAPRLIPRSANARSTWLPDLYTMTNRQIHETRHVPCVRTYSFRVRLTRWTDTACDLKNCAFARTHATTQVWYANRSPPAVSLFCSWTGFKTLIHNELECRIKQSDTGGLVTTTRFGLSQINPRSVSCMLNERMRRLKSSSIRRSAYEAALLIATQHLLSLWSLDMIRNALLTISLY